MTPDPESLLPVAVQAAALASDMMRTRRPAAITEKQDRDLVSDVDVAIERAVRAHLAQATPGIGFLGEEEGGTTTPAAGWVWALDPIDGTSNYTHHIPLCVASLALLHDGQPVLGVIDAPFLRQTYHATIGQGAYTGTARLSVSGTARLRDAVVAVGDYATGPGADRENETRLAITIQLAPAVHRIRMLGTAALDLAWVAEGRLDASVILGNQPWDTAAGVLIAREAGATVVDIDGSPHDFSSAATITAPAALIDQLVLLLRAADVNGNQDTPAGRASPYAALDAILSQARHLIFEFDGPVCDLSAALPPDTADRLGAIIAAKTGEPSRDVAAGSDPLAILARAAAISPDLGACVDAELTSIEVDAAATATLAGYIHEAIAACRDSGRIAAVVGRQSVEVVNTYLARYSLADQIGHVAATGSYPPGHLQTSAHLVEDTIRALQASPGQCALITPSATGIEIARTLGAHAIGYATTTATREHLTTARATCLVLSLADLTLRLRARPLPN